MSFTSRVIRIKKNFPFCLNTGVEHERGWAPTKCIITRKMVTEPNLVIIELFSVIPALLLCDHRTDLFMECFRLGKTCEQRITESLTELFWEFYSVVSVQECPNQNSFGIYSAFFVCIMVHHVGYDSQKTLGPLAAKCFWQSLSDDPTVGLHGFLLSTSYGAKCHLSRCQLSAFESGLLDTLKT